MDLRTYDKALADMEAEAAALHQQMEQARVGLEELKRRRDFVLEERVAAMLAGVGRANTVINIPTVNVKVKGK